MKHINNCKCQKCRLESPTEPYKIDDIKFFDRLSCPYCGKNLKFKDSVYQHLRKHFPLSKTKIIYEYIWKTCWKLPIPKCKNPKCNNTSKRKDLNNFGNFCESCSKLKEFSNQNAVKHLHTKLELKNMEESRQNAVRFGWKQKLSTNVGRKSWVESCRKSGKKISSSLIKHFGTAAGKAQIRNSAMKQSLVLKDKIKRGEFTPTITNSWTHWESKIKIHNKIIKFRSSWEACFYISNRQCEYEVVRVPYIDKNGNSRITIVDFFDKSNNILYELKPRSVFITQKEKMDAVISYCLKNNIKFVWINESNILNYVDKSKFSKYNIKQYNKLIQYVKPKN